jgi:tellurite resistance protein TehA-like permease
MQSTTSAGGAAAPAVGGRKPVAALVLGIVALVTGIAAITLLCAVIAITLASLTFQENAAGRGDPGRRALAVAGMVCGIVALCLWIPVVVAIAITES